MADEQRAGEVNYMAFPHINEYKDQLWKEVYCRTDEKDVYTIICLQNMRTINKNKLIEEKNFLVEEIEDCPNLKDIPNDADEATRIGIETYNTEYIQPLLEEKSDKQIRVTEINAVLLILKPDIEG